MSSAQDSMMKRNRAKMLFLKSVVGVVVVALLSLFVWYNFLNPEVKAKRVVNNYLKAINKGQKTDEYKVPNITDFYNVLEFNEIKDYKHLAVRTESHENNVDSYLLVYDVTITDKVGIKYYRKVYFTVDNSGEDHKFRISKMD
ncbi:MAG: hypothetical protein HPY50_17360 [Firmicutes bacterium]|nr:hypothetical protein [Bacillota bacterium]